MRFFKQFDNGLRLIINKMDGFVSVSAGVLVKTGSIKESAEENGISHFIEHVMFKGTKKRTAFEISDQIDKNGKDDSVAKVVSQVIANDIKKNKTLSPEKPKDKDKDK